MGFFMSVKQIVIASGLLFLFWYLFGYISHWFSNFSLSSFSLHVFVLFN